MEQTVQRQRRCPSSENIQGQVGKGSRQPVLVEDLPAHCKRAGLEIFKGPSQPKLLYDSVIFSELIFFIPIRLIMFLVRMIQRHIFSFSWLFCSITKMALLKLARRHVKMTCISLILVIYVDLYLAL